MWMGGVTEFARVVALASSRGVAVVPHGCGVYGYYMCMAFPSIPLAEFMIMSEQADSIDPNFGSMFHSEPLPVDGCSHARASVSVRVPVWVQIWAMVGAGVGIGGGAGDRVTGLAGLGLELECPRAVPSYPTGSSHTPQVRHIPRRFVTGYSFITPHSRLSQAPPCPDSDPNAHLILRYITLSTEPGFGLVLNKAALNLQRPFLHTVPALIVAKSNGASGEEAAGGKRRKLKGV